METQLVQVVSLGGMPAESFGLVVSFGLGMVLGLGVLVCVLLVLTR